MNPSTLPLLNKTLRIGHTPDPDDAFMFYGFASGQVQIDDYEVQHVLEDIQTLNQKALHGEIEVTAVSAAVYPSLQHSYWILPVGASVGRNYGPVVVKKAGTTPATKRIGIPGRYTTAFLLLRLYTEDYQPISYRFDEIPAALNSGDIDYGLLIHEAQITYESMGLEKVMNLGERWMEETRLPIPLGLDVVRKDLGKEMAVKIGLALKQSIQIGLAQREEAVSYAIKFGRGLSQPLGDQFIGMYVNNDTLNIGEEGERALNLLYDKAYRAGIIPAPTRVDILRDVL
jgi:1,4-dihydroxy-6-naphthoate synthase